jgi:AcrR family transcriptional regulator
MDKDNLSQRRKPTQGRSRQRVEKILDTAQLILVEQGFDAVTTVAIAERAEIPVGSIYYIFPSKFAIFYALYERDLGKVDGIARGPKRDQAEKMDWKDLLESTIDGLGEYWLQERSFPLLIEGIRNSPEMRVARMDQDERSENYNIAMLDRLLPEMADELKRSIAQLMVHTTVRMLEHAAIQDSQEEALRIVGELKRNLKSYIQSHIDDAGARHT